ncbi:MAG: helix-turn-helix domain-containing protein [Clostridia bacterium]|nr:helix-turn-helix domain-containing protein [Clostridia bacterium]
MERNNHSTIDETAAPQPRRIIAIKDLPTTIGIHATPKYNYLENLSKSYDDRFFVYAFFHDKRQFPLLMHCHNYYELNIITGGYGRHYIENNYVDAKIGSVFIVPPNIMHGYTSGDGLEIFHLALSDSFMNKFANELADLAGYSLLFEIEPILRSTVNEEFFLRLSQEELASILPEINNLVACENTEYSGIKTIKNAKALSIIGTLAFWMHQKKPSANVYSTPSTKNIIKSVEYIHENYMDKINVEALAEMCFMSYATLTRYFKKLFNVTPTEYIMNIRIKNAKIMLRTTDKSVSQIAQDCGFFDLSHFSHYFYKYEKTTPVKYRNDVEK